MVNHNTNETLTKGQRFSHNYIARGEPATDSERMRRRLQANLPEMVDIAPFLERKLGVAVGARYYSNRGAVGVDTDFFVSCQLRDALDAITLIYQFLCYEREQTVANRWRDEVTGVFKEENVRYRLDDECGVHFHVDSAFEGTLAASIAALDGPRYANALHRFEQAMGSMDATPPDLKTSIWSTFAAAEGLFKVMFKEATRLTASDAERYLGPVVGRIYKEDITAVRAGQKMLASLKDWIDACHFYRHEQGIEEPVQPPISAAILMISQGAGFIRWLAELDREVQKSA